MGTLKNTIINDTGHLTMPVGTTAQRPGTAANGMMRYNSNTGGLEAYIAGAWKGIETASEYEIINLVGNNGNLTINGNGTTTVSAFKTQGSSSWDTQVYMTTGYTAPVTMEFNKEASAGDNGGSYAMISWNADPTSDASYSSLDYAAYPYQQNGYYIYHNGSGSGYAGWSSAQKFYLVYATNGYMYHYNGSTLLFSVNYGTGATVYLDTSFYSPNSTYGGFSNIRIIKKAWNGTAYA